MRLRGGQFIGSGLLIVLLLSVVGFGTAETALEGGHGCTMIIVGKGATVDGSVLIARNEDYPGNWAKHIIVVPKKTHEEGEVVESATGFAAPQVPTTYGYLSLQDWDPTQGRFNAGGINEYQVAVTASTTARQNERAKAADPPVETGIGENIITALVLERAKTAREGVQLVGALVKEYGSSEVFGMAIADPDEAWLLEVGGGHHWVAARVPDDCYAVVPNALRIGEVDFSNEEYFLGSEDLISFAAEYGLFDPASEPFNFAKAYGTARNPSTRNWRRVWGAAYFLSPSSDFDPEAKWYPLFMQPDWKISPEDIMAVLRFHYQGTPYDPETPQGKGERAIGISNTLESHVLQVRGWLPNTIGGVAWICLSAPRTSTYVPYYSGITRVPKPYQLGTGEYDDESAYWTFRTVTTLTFTDLAKYEGDVRAAWETLEKRAFILQPVVEKTALELYSLDPELAIEFLTIYSNGLALEALNMAQSLGNDLLTKMAGQALGAYGG